MHNTSVCSKTGNISTHTAIIYYIGAAGRRNTGDWCFEDGFITFRDIADLYLRASSNFKGRVLTIISDCSYSGCWVRDCMEFLDDQRVEPCGHKAREKGMIIKVFTSSKSNEIPTEYCYSVNGVINDKNTGVVGYYSCKPLMTTQTTNSINSSLLRCNSKTIDEPCTLRPGYTWSKFRAANRLYLVRGENHGHAVWHYVLLEDDDDVEKNYNAQVASGTIDISNYGCVLVSGWGKDPQKEVIKKIDNEYLISSYI